MIKRDYGSKLPLDLIKEIKEIRKNIDIDNLTDGEIERELNSIDLLLRQLSMHRKKLFSHKRKKYQYSLNFNLNTSNFDKNKDKIK